MRILNIVFLLIIVHFCYGQNYFSKMFLKDAPNLGFTSNSIEMTDSSYLSINYITDINTNSGYINIEKTSIGGDSIWHKQYGEKNNWYWTGRSTKIGENYFLGGGEYLNGQDTGLAFLMKINSNGDSIWKKTYSHGANGENFFSEVITTSDSGLLAVGVRKNNENPLDTGLWNADRQGYVVKTDLNGNEIWHSIFGDNKHNETVISVIELPGKKYGIVGNIFELNNVKFEGFYYILDSLGKIIQKNIISIHKYDVSFGSLILTKKGNVLISGTFAESETYFGVQQKDGSILALYNLAGVKQWHKTYLQDISEVMIQDILELENGEIIAVGFTPKPKAYILKLSSTGEILWNRRLDHNQGDERFLSGLYDIAFTSDGMYICSGNASNLDDTLTGIVRTMPWLSKVDTNGCIVENCLQDLSKETNPINFREISAFPNPFIDNIKLNFPKEMLYEEVSIIVTDIQGKIIYKSLDLIKNEIYSLNFQSQLTAGLYIVTIQNRKKIKQLKLTHI